MRDIVNAADCAATLTTWWPAVLAQQNANRQPDGSYKATPSQIAEIREKAKSKAHITTKADPDGQCVTACKHFTGVPGPTTSWRAGKAATDLTDNDIGTAIGTFGSDGRYPTSGHMNSATFMGASIGGIWVADQWSGGPVIGPEE